MNKKLSIFDVTVSDISRETLIEEMVGCRSPKLKQRLYNVNLNALNLAYSCPIFRNYLSNANLVYNDGHGVRLSSYFLGQVLRYRHTVDDWMDEFLAVANSSRTSVFLLGDEQQVVIKASNLMRKKHLGLKIVGLHHGFFQRRGKENQRLVEMINEASPDILLVGMSMPIQEFWIEDNIEQLNCHAFVPVGSAFRWYCGVERRAPKWITDNGFEWLGRLFHHPIKLFSRYVIGNPIFFIRLFRIYVFKRPLPSECSKPLFEICPKSCDFSRVRGAISKGSLK